MTSKTNRYVILLTIWGMKAINLNNSIRYIKYRMERYRKAGRCEVYEYVEYGIDEVEDDE